jgi:hypothetical protein
MEIIERKLYNHARTAAKNATIGHWHAGPAIESTTLRSRCSALTNRATKSSCRALLAHYLLRGHTARNEYAHSQVEI